MFKAFSELFGVSDAARRVGVVDVGSNSVRLVIFLAETRIPAVLFNEKALCGLGAQLESTGRLSQTGREMALSALRRFRAISEQIGVDEMIAIGTAALRDAEDGAEFVAEAARETGIQIEVAEGRDEARLAAQGVALGDPWARGVVADMGGASLELVEIDAAGESLIGEGVTTPLGALRLGAQLAARERARVVATIDAELDQAFRQLSLGAPEAPRPAALYALGGSFRAFARAWMELRGYPLKVLHGYSLPYDEALEAANWVSKLKPLEIRQLADVSERRAAVTPPAALALARLIKLARPEMLTLSAFGLREGAYWERLPSALRTVDPLLDAAASIELRRGRAPGFGVELFEWLLPALDAFPEEERRLAHAACLLSDAGWRTHPDYRATTAFEVVTRNAFGGVDHVDRAYIGAALLHRHKGGRKEAKLQPALALASDAQLARAAALGLGMRFGAALCGAATGVLPRLPLRREGGLLILVLPTGQSDIGGEEAGKRLAPFATALGLEGRIEIDG